METSVNNDIKFLYVDLFCGAGGVTQGIESAVVLGKKAAKVIVAVNHDSKAIESHAANHPDAVHFLEDVRKVNILELLKIVNRERAKYPNAFLVLWASAECTNYSKAKGGKAKDADSRTLPNDLFRYIEILDPDYFQFENVVEFMSWGDIDENGKPISMQKGKSYLRWVKTIKGFGYDFDKRFINAADFGGHTSRVRYFAQFAKKGLPIAWCEPTHLKKPIPSLFEENQRGWQPVKNVLDLEEMGNSIFNRKKELAENTLRRIYEGLTKFVAEDKNDFLIQYYGKGRSCSIDEPSTTLTTKDRLALISVSKQFIFNPQWGGSVSSIENPCCVLIARQDKAPLSLVSAITGEPCLSILEDDSPTMKLIKEFMRMHGISDIRMRMLFVVEQKRIMGFPDEYKLFGSMDRQKKFIGNAVHTFIPKSLVESMYSAVLSLTPNYSLVEVA